MARAGYDLVFRGRQRQRVLIYQSFGGDYYALCGSLCQGAVAAYLSDPEYPARWRPAEHGHDDAPFCCWFCGIAINPETWGDPIAF